MVKGLLHHVIRKWIWRSLLQLPGPAWAITAAVAGLQNCSVLQVFHYILIFTKMSYSMVPRACMVQTAA